jgi:hypothetical protein
MFYCGYGDCQKGHDISIGLYQGKPKVATVKQWRNLAGLTGNILRAPRKYQQEQGLLTLFQLLRYNSVDHRDYSSQHG